MRSPCRRWIVGRKGLRETMATYKARVEQGQVECADLRVRDLSTAMLDAAREVGDSSPSLAEADWRPAFLKRQSNQGCAKVRGCAQVRKA